MSNQRQSEGLCHLGRCNWVYIRKIYIPLCHVSDGVSKRIHFILYAQKTKPGPCFNYRLLFINTQWYPIPIPAERRYLALRQVLGVFSVSRYILKIINSQVNSNDDDGVLEGRWSGGYAGGKSPTTWNGSVAILDQFMTTKKPVKYGQCWVFSGVLTTGTYPTCT